MLYVVEYTAPGRTTSNIAAVCASAEAAANACKVLGPGTVIKPVGAIVYVAANEYTHTDVLSLDNAPKIG